MPAKRGKAPESTGNEILDALRDFETQRTTRFKKERREAKIANFFRWLSGAPRWVKVALIAVASVVALLMVDGFRREGGEMRARAFTVTGQVNVVTETTQGTGPARPLTVNGELSGGDVVTTGPGASATLVFPDGSSVLVEQNTEFEVRLLDYTRDGRRDRTFQVRAGSVIANVSRFFGVGSQATICTPTAVAAVRGTGFRVVYSPAQRESYIQVVDGAVGIRTAAGALPNPAQPGEMVNTTGYQINVPRALPANRANQVSGVWNQMVRAHERNPGPLQAIEYAINGFFDPVLQVLGLAPGSWSYAMNNFARRGACQEALRRLHTHITGLGPDTPPYLNPVTLEELGQDPREVKKLTDTFANGLLESYTKTGQDTFVAQARARDRGHTLFEITEAGGVREVKQ